MDVRARQVDALRRRHWLLALVVVALVSSSSRAAEPSREQVEFFERKIRPVLVQHCYACHSTTAEKVRGGLLLDSRESMRKGGETGPAVVPGDLDASALLDAIRYDGLKMPPDGKLADGVIRDFETWIRSGAADPRDAPKASAKPASSGTPGTPTQSTIDLAAGRKFWSFQRPHVATPPSVAKAGWAAGREDLLILKSLEAAGLAPAAPADRRVLLRRASFDLVGLPPNEEDLATYLDDLSPDAFERAVDRLIAAPTYGERWARLWLDIARFAEDQAHIVGDDRSLCYPNAYLYRDWVIRAFNGDVPYDRFVRLQLAADLIEPNDTTNHAALGFIGLGPKYYDRGKLAVKADEWEDRVDVVSRGLLGLTVACARCHDHKFDPIPTTDYYALAGVFASTEMFNRPLKPEDAKESAAKDEAKKGEKKTRPKQNPELAMHIVRDGQPTSLAVFIRGNVDNKGPTVPRRFISVLSDGSPVEFKQGSGRAELADSIVRAGNPLAARVAVNRIWGALTGRPLVVTPSNFGATGERPSHPELLDELAVRFVEAGWSPKWLVRRIVLSSTYRQSSSAENATFVIDPTNRLVGRMNRRRLSVEAWRDSLLAVTDRLESRLGGPSLDPRDVGQRRRTIYSAVSRLELNRMLAMFDFPDPNMHSDGRAETTTPLQKLFVMNGPLAIESGKALTARLAAEVPATAEQANRRRVGRAYELVYGRSPQPDEIALALAFVGPQPDSPRWPAYAQVLLAANELLYVD